MSARRGAALLLAIVIATVQLGVPVVALFDSRPARFGWHMYSTLNPAPEAWAEDEGGNLAPVDLDALIADPRAEIRWSAPLADMLCRDDAIAAIAVVVTDREGTTRVPCP